MPVSQAVEKNVYA